MITATDIADRLGVASVGDPKLTERIPLETANKAYEAMRAMVEDAIGSAIPKVSGVSEKLVDYEETNREEALEHARQEAIAAAVRAGADESTAEIIDSEDVPLAYYPGKTSRIRVKAAGDLLMKH
ncbi:hypothetical protein [Bifidobacterium longum]|uniref:hypothetical protein n=1 Tax=Bifidobacterium longum TaxID=216816 RepID=UPI001F22156C|nr:hypothetical protein [Bifidobacterium longum]